MTDTHHKEPRIGIDIGRVIMAPVVGGRADTSFLRGSAEDAMRTPPSPGAFEGVRTLVDLFEGRAWLVSKCGYEVQRKTKRWLRHWDFYEETGLAQGNLRFCLKRPDKAIHCKQLKLTHFIDDRLDVLEHLEGLVSNLYLFGEQRNREPAPDWLTPVIDWNTATRTIAEDMAGPEGGR